MVIDIHTHAWPQKVAEKAKESLESLFKIKLVATPTIDTLKSYMAKNKIDLSVVCAVASRPEQVPSINQWLFSVRSNSIKAFCSLHPDYAKWKEELLQIKEKGDGIKLQPEFQDFYVDEEKLFPIYEEIQRLNLPILFHCGEELSGTMLVRSSPDRILKVRENFPKLKMVAAHFGGFHLHEEVKKYLLGKDIYFDTSFFFGHLPKEETREMILNHRNDRLLFGTDFPLIDQKQDLDYLDSLALPEELKSRILSLNAKELLGVLK